jgi:hypothetical protein
MKKYYRDLYGATASIRINRDGSATLKVADANGKAIYGKCYSSERAAKCSMGKLGDEWKEQK